jgi:hypothetical protein
MIFSRQFKDDMIRDTLLEESIEWIQSNLEPEDVFNALALEVWAEDNGYTLIDD